MKEYYNNGKLKFEGECLNNKKWNGKGYDEEGNIIYELMEQEKSKNMIMKIN